MNESDSRLAATELCKDLFVSHGILTLSELKIAFNLGYKGEFGPYFGLNVRTYFTWVNAYRYSKHRANTVIALHKSGDDINRKEPPTLEEQAKLSKENAINSFEYFKTAGVLMDIGNVTYRYLERLKIIAFTPEKKKEIAKAVKIKLADEQKIEKTKVKTSWQRDAIDEAIKKIQDGTTPTFVAECRREALRVFYKELIDMDVELKSLIDAKLPDESEESAKL